MFNWKRKHTPKQLRLGKSFPCPAIPPPKPLATRTASKRLNADEKLKALESIPDAAWNHFCTGLTARRLGNVLGLKGDVSDPYSEWSAYHRILTASSFGTKEIFVGVMGDTAQLVTRKILEGHVYILGGTGTGKTSIAVTQLLIQLARCVGGVAAPIFIFDLKPDGDRYLRATAERLVAERRAAGCVQESLDFFSNAAHFQSQLFDPWQAMQSYSSIKARAQALLSALTPTRVDKADAVFFLNENREILESVFSGQKGPAPQSFRELLERLDKLSRGKNGNREARGAHGALSDFNNMPHVRVDAKPNTATDDVDFARVFNEQRIMYVHLDTQNLTVSSRSVGRYMLFCLFAEAMNRSVKTGTAQEFYLFIDEFHEIASQNIGNFSTVARSCGARCIFSHQTTASHDSPALTEVLLQNTAVQMLLSPDDEVVMRAFTGAAGEKVLIVNGGSSGTSLKNGASSTSTHGGPFDWTGAKLIDRWSHGYGQSFGFDTSHGDTWQESRVSALTPDMIADLDSVPLTALVRVKKHGVGSDGKTKWRGVSFLNLLYPYTEPEAFRLSRIVWPPDTTPPTAQPAPLKPPPNRPVPHSPKTTAPPPALAATLKALTSKVTGTAGKAKKKTKTP